MTVASATVAGNSLENYDEHRYSAHFLEQEAGASSADAGEQHFSTGDPAPVLHRTSRARTQTAKGPMRPKDHGRHPKHYGECPDGEQDEGHPVQRGAHRCETAHTAKRGDPQADSESVSAKPGETGPEWRLRVPREPGGQMLPRWL